MYLLASKGKFYGILYTAKRSRGETFAVFVVFHSIVNVFLRIMALLIGNVSLQACYRKSFPTRKFYRIWY